MPGSQRSHTVAKLDHGRNAHAACHNGRMADGAVLVAGKAQNHAAVQAEQVTGEKAIGYQDAWPFQVQTAAGPTIQNIHHAAADVADVHTAFPDVFIVHIAQASGKNLFGALHGGRTARPGGYVITNLVGEGFVLQQGDLEQ